MVIDDIKCACVTLTDSKLNEFCLAEQFFKQLKVRDTTPKLKERHPVNNDKGNNTCDHLHFNGKHEFKLSKQ